MLGTVVSPQLGPLTTEFAAVVGYLVYQVVAFAGSLMII